jgi:ubiquinone/menaquinone biosynthesis C-methylase UbiE
VLPTWMSDIVKLKDLLDEDASASESKNESRILLFEVNELETIENTKFYESRVADYDANLHLTFDTHGESEDQVRLSLISKTDPKGKTVLDLAAGTGRDSVKFVEFCDKDVKLIALDPALEMLKVSRTQVNKLDFEALYLRASAEQIPLADNSVDVVYSFGGFNEFADKAKAMSEISRVARPGARVLLCDEGIPTWWRDTDFYRTLVLTNPQFASHPPLEFLPTKIHDVELSWAVGETFWVLSFKIADKEPTGNFDIPIPGKKGGTLRTRYEGNVQGVTSTTRELLSDYVQNHDLSEHEVVDRAIRNFLSERS